MKKKLLIAILVVMCAMLFVVSATAAAPARPDLGVDFGTTSTIDGFTPPSELYANTDERVLLTDGNGNYVTYPTYYITKDSTTFDVNFNNLNSAQSVQYTKASIVMLEIPNGVTTLNNSTFSGSGYGACVFVQIPGTVTSYGNNLFQTNSIIRAIEFLDGTTPVTMGDGMFTSNWSSGTTVLEYVKFPNNLTSIGNNTFGKSHASKTIILGENLTTIGTGFFGESTPGGKDTFIYVSDKFFADSTTMFKNLFGGFDKYHNNYLRITLFYAGSQEKAQAFVDAGLALDSGYIYKNLKLVSASEYDYATHKPTAEGALTMVYGYNKCDAFYGGNHNGENVGKFLDKNGQAGSMFLDDYVTICECTRCGQSNELDRISPLFIDNGFSYSNDAMLHGLIINKSLLDEYQAIFGDIKFGVVASAVQAEGAIIDNEGNGINKYVAVVDFTDKNFEVIEIKLKGITDDYKDTGFYLGAFAVAKEQVYYMSNNSTTTQAVAYSYNQIVDLVG